jgi:hypothetical protein
MRKTGSLTAAVRRSVCNNGDVIAINQPLNRSVIDLGNKIGHLRA